MDTRELLKKVRKIEIKTKGLTRHIFSGEYHSAFKGRGMSFSEVREYQFGDDVRNIDWNVTARTGDPHIKVFEEERELTVMMLVDVSPSCFYGTTDQFKNELITELCAVLAFSAIQNNDKVGLILFSEQVELYIPPKKGRKHILRIIRELIYHEPQGKQTNLNIPLTYVNNIIKKRSIVFILSDFLSEEYSDALRIAAKRHDIIGCKIYDRSEQELPKAGLLRVVDSETGLEMMIDSSNKRLRGMYRQHFENADMDFRRKFAKSNSDTLRIEAGASYIQVLTKFFKKRSR
jgi:uncharacterized protein (DUF58 family)